MLLAIFAVIFAYLLGSISFAIIVSKLMGIGDPRTFGSGNPGATNVLRSGKKTAAALTLLGDALKGWLAVFLTDAFRQTFGFNDKVIAIVAVAVIIGHMYPVFFKFKGGKGVATAFGVILALSWQTALICLLIWLIVAFGLKISSLAALIASSLSPFIAYFFLSTPYLIAITIIALLVLYRHKSNIKKLLHGKESKIGDKSSADKLP